MDFISSLPRTPSGDDMIRVKIEPWKGVIRFSKRGKLSP
ncbi:hypothetical protein Tco_0665756, partial [Tanacetum coccineum]